MKKDHKTITLLLIISMSFASYAQRGAVASGGIATGIAGSSTYTVGQLDYTSQTGTGGFATQGEQQPYEIVVLSKDDFTEITLVMSAYPNPTTDLLHLEVADNKWTDLSYQLLDMNGRNIAKQQKLTSEETLVSMQELQHGIYFLNVTNANKTVKTFKIIKK